MAMELDIASSGDEDNAQPICWVRDEFSINLNAQLAANIMLDRALKPKKTQFRYNDLPPRSPYPYESIEKLKKRYRRTMYDRIQLMEKTFGPEALAYPTPTKMVQRFEEDCKAVEEMYRDPNGTSQIIIEAKLEKLYKTFEVWLDMYYDGLLTHELEARYDLEMKKRRQRKKTPQLYNFYFRRGALFTFYNDPLNHTQLCHEPIAISPISPKVIQQRLLDEALKKRSEYTDKLFFFEILLKEVKLEEMRNTQQMENMREGLKQGFFRWAVLRELCVNIDKAAKMILRRFDVEYFFDENREFREFLHFWAMRYCLVAEKAWENSVTDRDWAKEVGKVLYALLRFLKVSHDALLEREVDAKLPYTMELVKGSGLALTSINPDRKSCIRRGKLRMIDKDTSNSRELVTDLMEENESASTSGEKEGVLNLSAKDIGLPHDRILLEIAEDEDERRRQEEAVMEDSDSESDDEMFPSLQDVIIDPIWNTKPEKGKIQSRLDARRSKVLIPCLVVPPQSGVDLAQPASRQTPDSRIVRSPISGSSHQRTGTPTRTQNTPTQNATDLNTRRQDRSMAPSPGPSKQARTTIMHASCLISSPARPVTPVSNVRVQTVNGQDNGSSKSILVPTLRTPAIDQHNRRPAHIPDQSREKSNQTKGNQMHHQGGTQQRDGRNVPGKQVGGSVTSMNAMQSPIRSQVALDRSSPNRNPLHRPSKLNQIDPHERLNKWLNDPTISITKSISTAQRPGEPFYPPPPDIEQLFTNQRITKIKPQPAQTQTKYRTPEDAYQYSYAGQLAKQRVAEALSTDLNINPRWPSSVLDAGVPYTEDWSSRQMPPPAKNSSWAEWSKERSEHRIKENKLTDKEFEDEISRAYD